MKCFIHSANEKITEGAADRIAGTPGTFVFGEKCAQWSLRYVPTPIKESISLRLPIVSFHKYQNRKWPNHYEQDCCDLLFLFENKLVAALWCSFSSNEWSQQIGDIKLSYVL